VTTKTGILRNSPVEREGPGGKTGKKRKDNGFARSKEVWPFSDKGKRVCTITRPWTAHL